MVAPFEADAQLAYLNKIGYIHGVVSEDSDMLMFGTNKLLTKFGLDYRFKIIEMETILASKQSPFQNWDHDNIVKCGTLAGCDYMQTLKGIALKKAIKMFESQGHIEAVFKDLRTKREEFDEDEQYYQFRDRFERAYLAFKYQKIWCPNKKKMVSLNPLPFSIIHAKLAASGGKLPTEYEMYKAKGAVYDAYLLMKFAKIKDGFSFLGTELPREQAELIITGKMNPITKELFTSETDKQVFKIDWNELTFEQLNDLGFQKLAADGINSKRPAQTHNDIRLHVLSKGKHPEDSDEEDNQPQPVEVLEAPRPTCLEIAPHLFAAEDSEDSIPAREPSYKSRPRRLSHKLAVHHSPDSGPLGLRRQLDSDLRTEHIGRLVAARRTKLDHAAAHGQAGLGADKAEDRLSA